MHNEILLLDGTQCSAYPSLHQNRPSGEDAGCPISLLPAESGSVFQGMSPFLQAWL